MRVLVIVFVPAWQILRLLVHIYEHSETIQIQALSMTIRNSYEKESRESKWHWNQHKLDK